MSLEEDNVAESLKWLELEDKENEVQAEVEKKPVEPKPEEPKPEEPKRGPTLKFASNEGKVFEVPKKAAMLSRMVKRMLEDLGLDEAESYDEVIPIQKMDTKILELVVEWCIHHMNDPPVVEIDNREKNIKDIPDWDKEMFAKLDQSTIFELILAANFLDIYMLLDSGCKIIAGTMIGKTTAQLRKMLGITNDFTPAEEERIRKEHSWVED